MSRLTRKEAIIIRGNETAACNYENNECNDSCRYGICKWQEKANMRLKKYEDTELTPEQVQQLKERDTAKIPYIEGDGCDNNGNIIYDTWICPNCKEYYEVEYDDYDFCPKCGQKIDLSELNN